MIHLPTIKVFVAMNYLNPKECPIRLEAGYLMAAQASNASPILFTVYLESGAIFSRLPIEALRHKPLEGQCISTEELQPYSCLEGPVSVISYTLLKSARANILPLGMEGEYLFTLSYEGDGLASDSEQSKTHNIFALDNGQYAAMPNNMSLFKDNWFAYDKLTLPNYRRSTKRYTAGG